MALGRSQWPRDLRHEQSLPARIRVCVCVCVCWTVYRAVAWQRVDQICYYYYFLLLLLSILTANGVLLGDSGNTIRHNKQHPSHKITPRSNETQHTKLHTQ
jgi:hypothetical protein